MPEVLILHGYSAENRGDGLLVEEALSLVYEALGSESKVTLCASHPESFMHIPNLRVVDSGLRRHGYNAAYIEVLRAIKEFDLVVGVGGGYLRAGYPMELLKTTLIHGPQLLAASIRGKSVVYLPQSIGPLKYGTRRIANRALLRLETVMLRDDRSLKELNGEGVVRIPDVAALAIEQPECSIAPHSVPVLSVRELRGKLPQAITDLAKALPEFDGYIQSNTSGNDDEAAMRSLNPSNLLTNKDYASRGQGDQPRVIVAMRLHGALMALRAGHFVIHLAYERKGFGAFADLGLGEYVHNTRTFDQDTVLGQIRALQEDAEERKRYAEKIKTTTRPRNQSRNDILIALRRASR